MLNFYKAVIESVLTFLLIVWFGSSTVQQRSQICNILGLLQKLLVVIFPLLMRLEVGSTELHLLEYIFLGNYI